MVDTDFDFSTLNVTESPAPESPKPDDVLRCKELGCSEILTYGGRGPKPKYCASHKKRPTSNTRSRSKKNTGTDYRQGILGMFQLPAGVLAVLGMNKPELAADASTISMYAPGIAEALNELAKTRPEVAAALDRVLQVGPYGILIAAVMPMVMQILTNHGILPPGMMGTVPKEAFIPNASEHAPEQENE